LSIQSELSGGYPRQLIYIQTRAKTTNKHLAVKYYVCVKILSSTTRGVILTFGMIRRMSRQAVDIFPDHELTASGS
jgi:hypothetical protein